MEKCSCSISSFSEKLLKEAYDNYSMWRNIRDNILDNQDDVMFATEMMEKLANDICSVVQNTRSMMEFQKAETISPVTTLLTQT